MARRRYHKHKRTALPMPSTYKLVKPSVTELRDVVTNYFTEKCMVVNHELGLCRGGRFRADVTALSMKGELTIVEIKSSVADFRSDKKWHNYLQYCNRLYFCMNAAVYRKVADKIPKGVGVILVKVYKQGDVFMASKMKIVQRADLRTMDAEVQFSVVIRAAFRNAEFNRIKRRVNQ